MHMKKKTIAILFSLMTLGVFAAPRPADAARLYAVSAEQTVSVGQTVVVEWYLDTQDVPLNVISGSIDFTSDTLGLVSVTGADSAVSLWVTQPALTAPGVISFSGGIPAGISGAAVPFLRTTFRSIKTGTAALALGSDASAYASDGHATEEALTFQPLQFSIFPQGTLPVAVVSPTNPNQSLWYSDPNVVIRFAPKAGDAYSYSFSTNPEIIPSNAPMDTNGEADFHTLPDGIYTFKLNSKTGAGNWQEAGVYQVQIDGTPPEAFAPVVSSDPEIFAGKKFVSFSTTDKVSGLSYYEEKAGWFGWYKEVTTPYAFSRPLVGDTLSIRAVDHAGNARVETVQVKAYLPSWLFVILLLVCIIVCSILVRRKRAWLSEKISSLKKRNHEKK